MDSPYELPRMRLVRTDDIVPGSRWAASPGRALVGGLIVLGLVIVSILFGIRRRRG